MNKNQLENALSFLFEGDVELGFEMYIVMESDNGRVVRLTDLGDDALSTEIKNGFLNYLKGRTLDNPNVQVSPMSELSEVESNIHFYDLATVPRGLEVMDLELNPDDIPYFNFDTERLSEAKAFLLKFSSVDNQVILYKQHYHLNVLKQTNGVFIFRDDHRFTKPSDDQGILRFSFTMDFLKVAESLFVYDLKCLEREFNFNDILVKNAGIQINEIEALGFVDNIGYLQEFAGDKIGARKILKLRRDSPVLTMPFQEIKDFVQNNEYLSRRLKFNDDETQFHLHTLASRVYFIKLLNDDYLTSNLTNTQYDSEKKSEMVDEDVS